MRLKVKPHGQAITHGPTSNDFLIKVETAPVDGLSLLAHLTTRRESGVASETVYTITPSTVYLETKAYNVTMAKDDFSTVTLVGRLLRQVSACHG